MSSSIFTAPLLAIICHASATESTDGQTDGRRRQKPREVPAISGAGFWGLIEWENDKKVGVNEGLDPPGGEQQSGFISLANKLQLTAL